MYETLFDYKYEKVLNGVVTFYECTLNQGIGVCGAGTKLHSIQVDHIKGIMSLRLKEDSIPTHFKIHALAGEFVGSGYL